MRRLDRVLTRVAERGDPLGADLLIDHLERKLMGEPDPIVVARQRNGIMQTVKERTTQQPGPPTRRKGLAVALASFVVALVAGGGILFWVAFDDNGDNEVAAPATSTQVSTTTQVATTAPAPSASGDTVGTFTFDGTTWTYDGPTSLEAGTVTFSLINNSSQDVGVFSWFGLGGDELEAELAANPVGTDLGTIALAPPPPPGDYLTLVEAAPGQTVSATSVMGTGAHLIDTATMTAGGTDHLWRIALIEVTAFDSAVLGDAVGTFTFDGTTWTYDGPTSLEAGLVTFSLINNSSQPVGVFSWFGLGDDELEAELAANPVGTDLGTIALAPPPPPADYLALVEAEPGETVSAARVMGAGDHLIDTATMTAGGTDHLWRVALLEVTQP